MAKKNYPKVIPIDLLDTIPREQWHHYRQVVIEYREGCARKSMIVYSLGRKWNHTHALVYFRKHFPNSEVLRISDA